MVQLPVLGGVCLLPAALSCCSQVRGEQCPMLPTPGHRTGACTTSRGHTGPPPPFATSRVPFLRSLFSTCLVNSQTSAGGYWSHHKGGTSRTNDCPAQPAGASSWVWQRGQWGAPGKQH